MFENVRISEDIQDCPNIFQNLIKKSYLFQDCPKMFSDGRTKSLNKGFEKKGIPDDKILCES